MPTSDYTPNVSQVGAILRARTKDKNGVEVGTFNADTRPTDAQVTEQIGMALQDVASAIGADIPATTFAEATGLAALGAALQVELSYFPEQVANQRSPYAQLKQLYDDRLKRLILNVAAAGGTDPSGGAGPAYSFPMTGDRQIIGRRTPW